MIGNHRYICPGCLMRALEVKLCKTGLTFSCKACNSRTFSYDMKALSSMQFVSGILEKNGLGDDYQAADIVFSNHREHQNEVLNKLQTEQYTKKERTKK